MNPKSDIDYPPLPSQALPAVPPVPPTAPPQVPPQVPPQAPPPPSPTPEQKIKSIYSNLAHQLASLQTKFVLRSESNNAWHRFLVPYLPPLLTGERADCLDRFRRALNTIVQRLVLQNSRDTRCRNFANALLWAVDIAYNTMYDMGETTEIRVLQAIHAIFSFVTRFCNQEWGLERIDSNNPNQVLNIAVEVPSKRDPIYHPGIARKTRTMNDQGVESAQVEAAGSSREILPESTSLLFPSKSQLIHRDGKVITPSVCIQRGPRRCLVPFLGAVKEKSNVSDDDLEIPSKYLEVRYRDGTFYDFIPMQDVRCIYQSISGNLSATEKARLEKRDTGCIEVDGWVFDTLIKISKRAYKRSISRRKAKFLMDIKLPWPRQRTGISISTSPSCYVRVVDAQRFRDCPIWEAFDICRHDLCGYALLNVEYLEQIDGTRILISLIGMIVEKNMMNHGDAIFGLLDSN